MRQGDIAADHAARSGQMWGNVVQTLADIPMGMQQRKVADAEKRERALDREMARANIGSQIAERETAANERGYARMDKAAETDQKRSAEATLKWLADLAGAPDEDTRKTVYAQGRSALVSNGAMPANAAPETYPGLSWVKSRFIVAGLPEAMMKQFFPDPQPKKTREVRVRRPDGTYEIQIVEDVPGQVFQDSPEQPALGSKEDIYASYSREFLGGRTPSQMTASEKTKAERWWGEQTRVPERGPAPPRDSPQLPRGVENYIAELKRRGYDRAAAQKEIYGTWSTLTRDHPNLSAREVQRTIDALFPTDDFFGAGAGNGSVFGGGAGRGAGPVGAPSGRGSGAGPMGQPQGRAATSADVSRVATEMGISVTEAARRLEAQGVVIRD